MAGEITFGGLASGLDTNAIIDKLVEIERRPVLLLQNEVTAAAATKDAIGSLGAKLAAFRAAATALGTKDDVLVRAATSSNADVLTAAAGAGAARGALTLTVTQLARGSVAGASVGVASTSSAIATGPGAFAFQVGAGAVQTIAVDATTTLEQLAAAINDLDAGVIASAVNLGTGASPDYRLELVSEATGASSTVTVVRDDTALLVQTTQAGQNAEFTVAGFGGTFVRETNTVGDVLPGVTLALKTAGTSTVTVGDDVAAITAKVRALVDAFNDVVRFVGDQSGVQERDDKAAVALGSLATDTTAKRLLDRLHDVFSSALAGAGPYVNLSSLGLSTVAPGSVGAAGRVTGGAGLGDGMIAFDETKFRTALGNDPDALAQVLAGTDAVAGIADRLAEAVAQATGAGGVLANRTRTLDEQIRSLQDQIDARQRAVDATEVYLRQQFASLETFVNGLKAQGDYLASALGQ